jgi:hypothetical protein
MLNFPIRRVVTIGEATPELAPVAKGTYARGFAGDTFTTLS